MPVSIEQNDRYVGKVFGNILDFYDNATYNLRLYMIDSEISNKLTVTKAFQISEALAPPEKTVILAQTGVTGIQIDDLQILSLQNPSTTVKAKTVDFNVIEPGMAGFLDYIQLAKGYLNYENTAELDMFLEIRFQGYEADSIGEGDQYTEGGKPTVIAGPYIYKITITNIDVSLTEKGASYRCTAQIKNEIAYSNDVFRTKQLITTKGKTITEHVGYLQDALNEWQKTTTSNRVPDEFEFDLSNLIGTDEGGVAGLGLINDDTLVLTSDPNVDKRNRPLNELYTITDTVEATEAIESAGKESGTAPEAVYDTNIIKFQAGITLEEIFIILLSMCPEVESKISRKEDFSDVDSAVKKDQAFVNWFKVYIDVELLDFDKHRNLYAKKYLIKPVVFKTTNNNVALDPEEHRPNEDEKFNRVSQLKDSNMLQKAYNYIFTGLNDQILSIDVSYNTSLPALLPPKYGAIGSFRTSPYVYGSGAVNAVPENVDVTVPALVENVVNVAKESKNTSSIIDLLKGVVQDQLDGVVNSLYDLVSFNETPDSIREKLQNKTDLRSLAEQVVAQADTITLTPQEQNTVDNPTEDPTVIQDVETSQLYTPEPSGFIYAADFITADTDPVYAEKLGEVGYVGFDEEKEIEYGTRSASSSNDYLNPVDDATGEVASPKNKLFGFLTYQNRELSNFLITIDLTIRGDPWYLGSPDVTLNSSDVIANFNKDDNHFWLNIGAPIAFDPDHREEDSPLNSGYWDLGKQSKTFSGLYRMLSVVNRFSGGVFTTEINAHRLFNLNRPATAATDSEANTDSTTTDTTDSTTVPDGADSIPGENNETGLIDPAQ